MCETPVLWPSVREPGETRAPECQGLASRGSYVQQVGTMEIRVPPDANASLDCYHHRPIVGALQSAAREYVFSPTPGVDAVSRRVLLRWLWYHSAPCGNPLSRAGWRFSFDKASHSDGDRSERIQEGRGRDANEHSAYGEGYQANLDRSS